MTPCARVWWDERLQMDHRCERPMGHAGGELGCECRCQPRWWLDAAMEESA